MIIDSLIEKIREKDNPSVVGIDTDFNYLPDSMKKNCKTLEDAAKAIAEFNFSIIDSIKSTVAAVKVQVAYYEMYGVWGMETFKNTLDYAKKNNLFTIADIKRNDIGSTAEAYSKAYLSGVSINGQIQKPAFDCDFITINPYLGSDGLRPFVEDMKKNDKGGFVLVKTSNPSSSQIQNKIFEDNKKIYQEVARIVKEEGSQLIGKYNYSALGAVVGATHPKEGDLIREENPNMFFLIPGYGAQGGKAEDLKGIIPNGEGGVVNSSRAILCAYKNEKYKGERYDRAAFLAALEMKEDLNKSLR